MVSVPVFEAVSLPGTVEPSPSSKGFREGILHLGENSSGLFNSLLKKGIDHVDVVVPTIVYTFYSLQFHNNTPFTNSNYGPSPSARKNYFQYRTRLTLTCPMWSRAIQTSPISLHSPPAHNAQTPERKTFYLLLNIGCVRYSFAEGG